MAECITRLIEHTLLKPDATNLQVDQLCAEAVDYGFFGVCVNPFHIARVAKRLRGTCIKIVTVIGFPLGATTSEVKIFESRQALRAGAQELDVVINIGALKTQNSALVQNELAQIVKLAGESGLVKAILETGLLDRERLKEACLCAQRAGTQFVKTSTGFGPSGASVQDVVFIRQTLGKEMRIKAAGGIRSLKDAQRLVKAGAHRLGTSAGVVIAREMGS